MPVLEWLRMPQKSSKKSSVVWKETIASVKVIEKGLAWNVGDGTQVILVRDPWVGFLKRFSLTEDLIEFLNNKGLFSLNQIADHESSSIWKQEWLTRNVLQLVEIWLWEWRNYILDL